LRIAASSAREIDHLFDFSTVTTVDGAKFLNGEAGAGAKLPDPVHEDALRGQASRSLN